MAPSRVFAMNLTRPLSGPSFSAANIAFNSSTIFSGWGVFTGTTANDMPFMTSTSNTEIESSMLSISAGEPLSARILRASSACTIAPFGTIGSSTRATSVAETYFRETTRMPLPAMALSAGPSPVAITPVAAWSAGAIR